MPKNFADLRFVVKDIAGNTSLQWRLWATRHGDVYLAARGMAKREKYSFHKSGICRSAFTQEHGTPKSLSDRAMYKWKRRATPGIGGGEISLVAVLVVPTNYLSRQIESPAEATAFIAAAPAGSATNVEFFFTRESEASVRAAFEQRRDRFLVKYIALSDEEAFCVSYFHAPFKNEDLTVTNSGKQPDLLFSQNDPQHTGRPIRIRFGPRPLDGKELVLFELGGYRAVIDENQNRLFGHVEVKGTDATSPRGLDPIGEIVAYEQAALAAIAAAPDAAALEAARVEYAGRKHGRMRDVQALLGKVDAAQRPVVGKRFNEAKTKVESALELRQTELARPKAIAGGLDITLPGTPQRLGKRHPLVQTMDELKDIMGRFGFSVAEGPEIENEWHNFEALNIPEVHPARDPLDNFYLATASVAVANMGRGAPQLSSGNGGPVLLRTQTSTVQIRVMENQRPPVRVISPGRVFRPDTMDASHSCMFHQIEGLMVDRGVTMAQLKTVIRMLFSSYLEHDVSIRFRPSFFPFTEPSVEVDIPWGDDWMEIGGAGMVDPHVLSAVGYDPDEYTGFAFGLGIERLCMKRHGITDIRRFYENDIRFLRQF